MSAEQQRPAATPVSREQIEGSFERLLVAIEGQRSLKYCLRRWSEFVRLRDAGRCVVCWSTTHLSAHHIIRRSFIPKMQLEPGNGITLCRECHRRPHEAFNRRPDLKLPMDFEGGDSCDVITGFFAALVDDGSERGILSDDFYYLSESALSAFRKFQGIDASLEFRGYLVEQACLIWQQTPRPVLEWLLRANGVDLPPGFIQKRGLSVFEMGDGEIAVFTLGPESTEAH